MITKTVEIKLNEDELLDDIGLEDMIDYLSYNAIGTSNIGGLTSIVNNSLLQEEEIKDFLEYLDDDILKVMKKLIKENSKK